MSWSIAKIIEKLGQTFASIFTSDKISHMSKEPYSNYDWSPVVDFEVGGEAYYNKALKRPEWPGGASGITIGIGADLGYMTTKEFNDYFAKYFTEEQNSRLRSVIGRTGVRAYGVLAKVRDIQLSWKNAMEAFTEWTLPKFWKLSNGLWPGLDQLCIPAQVALVSIVFNRGSSSTGASRREMANIKPLVLKKDYRGIAKEIRSMKRLWINKGLDGLLRRRDIEAKMVESCL